MRVRFGGKSKRKKWSGWQELNLREHAPKACGWTLPYTRTWWLVTELNRVHWYFRPALCRRVHEPNFWWTVRDSNRGPQRAPMLFLRVLGWLELALHGCRPWVIPLYEPPTKYWGEMRESNSPGWSHRPVPKPLGQSHH